MRVPNCPRIAGRLFVLFSTIPTLVLLGSSPSIAQDATVELVHGYVTSTDLPGSFDIDGEHIFLQPLTSFGLKKGKAMSPDDPLRSELRPGAYVWVLGKRQNKKPIADAVLFRDERNQQVGGLGPVDALVSQGAEPVFRADGYTIQIPASAATSFHGDVHNLHEIGANTWLHYKGKLDSHGVLQASVADFVSTKPKRVKIVNGVENFGISLVPPDFTQHVAGRVKLGRGRTWHAIPADRALQDRLQRIGMKLVPSFQRSLPDDHPGKIKFRFLAIEDKKLHSFFCSSRGGLILYPRHLVERMQNDDQLAAALAIPVAVVLQRQGISKEMRQWPAVRDQLSTLGLYAAMPLAASVPLDLMGALPDRQISRRMEQQVGRIALSLTADAGYDPWQAPKAYRLLAPKELPKDMANLKYTDLSEYLLGILNLAYRPASAAETKDAVGSPAPAK
jgi:hypothetical protein